ncbi:hypothetical protein BDQ17DRAFT_1426575 [Cyathus striatus]|nr:hypothetical protein BDQ17DRAFT_1426575 [Cyathus striatus]
MEYPNALCPGGLLPRVEYRQVQSMNDVRSSYAGKGFRVELSELGVLKRTLEGLRMRQLIPNAPSLPSKVYSAPSTLERSQGFQKARLFLLPPPMGSCMKERGARMMPDERTGSFVQAKATVVRWGGIGGFNGLGSG